MFPQNFRKQPTGSRGCVCSFAFGGAKPTQESSPLLIRNRTVGREASSVPFKHKYKPEIAQNPSKKKSLKKENKENISQNLFETFER